MQLPSNEATVGSGEYLSAQDVLIAAQRLPSTAQVFAQVNRMLDDPSASLEDITELIRIEPVLSFRVLQLANGAFYGFRTPCSDLNEAVTRLGFREVNRLVGMVAAQHLCANFLSVYGISGDLFWSDSLCSALACEWLTHRHAFSDVRTAYTAGLLRSVGKVTMHRILSDRPLLWKSYLETGKGMPLLAWEKSNFRMTSVDSAGLIMQSWKMPKMLVDAMRTHCEPSGDEPLPYLMYLGSVVAAKIGGALPGEGVYWEKQETALTALEMDVETLQACANEVEVMFERVKRAVAI